MVTVDGIYREVDFGTYCPFCRHFKKTEEQYPCVICLEYTVNEYTDKPVKYEEDPKLAKRKEKGK